MENQIDEAIGDAKTSLELSSRALGDRIATQFYERYGDVQAFARNTVFHSLDNPRVKQYVLDEYARIYGIYDVILFLDTEGNPIAVNSKDRSGRENKLADLDPKTIRNSPWFQAARNEKYSEDSVRAYTGAFYEDFHQDTVNFHPATPVWRSSFSAPVKDADGKLIGVMTARSSTEWVDYELRKELTDLQVRGFPNPWFQIVQKSGTLLFEHGAELGKSPAVGKPGEAPAEIPVQFDFNRVGKWNVLVSGPDSLQAAVPNGQNGVASFSSDSLMAGQPVTAGYTSLQSSKWPSFAPWTVIAAVPDAQLFADAHSSERKFWLYLALTAVFTQLIGFWIAHKLGVSLRKVAQQVEADTRSLSGISTAVANSSDQLSQAATQQAAALQETAAAVDEISAMVIKNSEQAQEGSRVSEICDQAALAGQQAVMELLSTMESVDSSTQRIESQTHANNSKIGEIVKVISELGEKTKIINEIVFQTKLLSFNASVEAARAGIHGKGFAVVAEEVGKLAQMSGDAANQIEQMLTKGVSDVQAIVADAQSKIDSLLQDSRSQVAQGLSQAKTCDKLLVEIKTHVEQTQAVSKSIATASAEQAKGIEEVGRAMSQMDQVTQQNATVAHQSAESGSELVGQTKSLQSALAALVEFVEGGGHRSPASSQSTGSPSGPDSSLEGGPSKDQHRPAGDPSLRRAA